MFFDNWSALLRVAVMSITAYAWLVLVLRISGKRTLAKLNAFDFVVTVALGSTLASAILSKDVTWAQAALAFAMLALLQYAVAKLTRWFGPFHSAVRSSPRLLLFQGEPLEEAMRKERIAHSDIRAAARNKGAGNLKSIYAIVLETDGTLSVIKDEGDCSAMKDVAGYDPAK